MFEQGADRGEIIGVDIVDEEDHVRIAHIDDGGSMQDRRIGWTVGNSILRVSAWLAQRYVVPVEPRAAHIDRKNRLGEAQAVNPPAAVSKEPFARVPRVSIQATQRVPLPQASAWEPSLLWIVTKASAPARGFVQDHELIESEVFPASDRARLSRADGQVAAAQIEIRDLVAEPIHFDDEPICERAQRGQVHSSMASNPPCIFR